MPGRFPTHPSPSLRQAQDRPRPSLADLFSVPPCLCGSSLCFASDLFATHLVTLSPPLLSLSPSIQPPTFPRNILPRRAFYHSRPDGPGRRTERGDVMCQPDQTLRDRAGAPSWPRQATKGQMSQNVPKCPAKSRRAATSASGPVRPVPEDSRKLPIAQSPPPATPPLPAGIRKRNRKR